MAIVYLALSLLLGALLIGVAFGAMVLGGVLLVIFMLGYLLWECIQWIKGKNKYL